MSEDHPISWRDNATPISDRFDDPFFSLENGLRETEHVFLSGNDLPARLCDGFHIAELGFGTGLNFLALWRAWESTGRPGQIHFTSFEAYPLTRAQSARALARFPDLHVDRLLQAWPVTAPYDFGPITLTLVIGDARQTLPSWMETADAWFLDGFSPAKNPQLWELALLQTVYDHTKPGGTCATYTAAGHVRDALSQAGFMVRRDTGYGRKKHMTKAVKP